MAKIEGSSARHSASALEYLRRFKFHSLLWRNFVLILLLVALPVGAASVVFNVLAWQGYRDEVSAANMSAVRRSADAVDTVIRDLKGLCYNLSVLEEVGRYVAVAGYYRPSDITKLTDTLRFLHIVFRCIDSIYIYAENKSDVITDKGATVLSGFADKGWLQAYDGLGGRKGTVMLSRKKNGSYPFLITLICPVRSSLGSGAIVLNANAKELGRSVGHEWFYEYKGGPYQRFLITDDENRLFFSSDRSDLDSGDYAPPPFAFLAEKTGEYSEGMRVDGRDAIVSGLVSHQNGWKYTLITPMAQFAVARGDAFRLALLPLFAVLLCLLVAYFISLRAFAPIRRIIDEIERPLPLAAAGAAAGAASGAGAANGVAYGAGARNDAPGAPFGGIGAGAPQANADEIQYITEMVRQTKETRSKLQMDLDERMGLLNSAQTQILQCQIEPHMIYNTLDSIHSMAASCLGHGNKVSEMAVALADLLRLSLKRGAYLVSVSTELEHCKLYLRLLDMRYEGRIQVRWEIDSGILGALIVKLSLQPLLENAVYHGLRPKRYIGGVLIRGERADDLVVISVEDDGVGIPEGELIALNDSLKTQYLFNDRHVGIGNVNQRFKLLFGENSGVALSPRQGGGLRARLVFPYVAQPVIAAE